MFLLELWNFLLKDAYNFQNKKVLVTVNGYGIFAAPPHI